MSSEGDRTLDERTVQAPAPVLTPGERYVEVELLAAGGMGEVRLVHDRHIGREVAIKSVLPAYAATPMVAARFAREALVQARLEHPSVVPVYDVVAAPGAPHPTRFTMRRIAGRTLEEILAALARGDEAIAGEYGPRRLLAAFASVCLCLDYAHRRGVVHRDLKPSNLMLGEFGEVYVLDWGVARVLDEAPLDPEGALGAQTHETAVGAVVGTPGYMAPEQARGELARIDGRADVYALGAILFEILTLEKLYPTGSQRERIEEARRGVDATPSARTPARHIPPELDQICKTACATEAAARFPSARALHDAVQRFLEGDRDRELRDRLAREHLEAGRRLVPLALEATASGEARRDAARAVARAIALDPTRDEALRLMSTLVLTPAASTTAAVDQEIAEERQTSLSVAARSAALGYFGFAGLLLPVLWMGVLDWRPVLVTFGASATAGLGAWLGSRPRTGSPVHPWVVVVSCLVGLGGLTRMFGPLVALPSLAVLIAATFAIRPVAVSRGFFSAALASVIVLTVLLEQLGVVPASYRFEGGAMVVLPQMNALPGAPTLAFLTLASVFAILMTSLYIGRVQAALDAADRKLRIHTWHLRQVFPSVG